MEANGNLLLEQVEDLSKQLAEQLPTTEILEFTHSIV
jgi:hypothetical protein